MCRSASRWRISGVLGALNFWPLAIYFPAEMYLRQRNIKAWTRMWVVFQAFRAVCLVVIIVAFVGSMEGLIISERKICGGQICRPECGIMRVPDRAVIPTRYSVGSAMVRLDRGKYIPE
ncbi:hypothetical protein HYC85_014521 [Camellia sinensis]|uniref:Amino acid transporter transmembrane domain-containing protein n=1 Tax=Camellia sinensis TaxID=4442 RepID=A0A7J7H9N9_CAMSI|nr:hypothetical protein HYC85_014521 [Camellia sinensis]